MINGKPYKKPDSYFWAEKYASIPDDIRERARDVALAILHTDDLIEPIKKAISDFGRHEWIYQENFNHFFFGMWFRNQLRSAGITDDLVPDKNLDDYYVSIIENALGFD